MLAEVSANNAWLSVLTTFFPGLLLIYVYINLLKKSSQPFPLMLEEHLGCIGGRILGLVYILIFLIITSFYLRFFIEFLKITVLTDTPTSLIILLLLIPGTYAIRSGIEVLARISQVILVVFMPLSILLLMTAATEQPDLMNLMPVGFISIRNLSYAVYLNMWHFGNMMIILTLAYFSNDRHNIPQTLLQSIVTLVLYLSIAMAVSTITLGTALSSISTFPLFEIARSASFAGFIRNTEPLFVSIFMAGIFISVTTFWIMSCYSTQQIFRLKDYRFLAAPSAVIIGFGSVLISPNTFMVFSILQYAAPLIFGVFLIAIPVLLYILLLFKPGVKQEAGSGLQPPEVS